MKINEEIVRERMKDVPERNRAHIYDAGIIIEFFSRTFMPTKFFLKETFRPTPGMPVVDLLDFEKKDAREMSVGTLYDLYKLFREERDYTSKIESKYIFSLIVRNLRYYKNGWEFRVRRVSRAQIWSVSPLILRSDLPTEILSKYALVEKTPATEAVVEADPLSSPGEEDGVNSWTEAREWVEAHDFSNLVFAYAFANQEFDWIEAKTPVEKWIEAGEELADKDCFDLLSSGGMGTPYTSDKFIEVKGDYMDGVDFTHRIDY